MDKLTNELIAKVANKLNLEPALLKTVTVVECGNRDGFLPCLLYTSIPNTIALKI